MPVRNIRQAIRMGLSVPLNKAEEVTFNELKDFIAHEAMKFSQVESEQLILIEFFKHLFEHNEGMKQ